MNYPLKLPWANWLKQAATLVGLGLSASLLCTLFIIADGLQDRLGYADAGLVLGNSVNQDGTLSPRLQARLDKALALYRSGYFRTTIITSGAVGKEGHDEAAVMKGYLVAQGVSATDILVDSHGNTTFASARNTSVLARQHHFNSVLVVSQYYHLPRSRFILQRCHLPNVYSAPADFFELRDVYSSLRETAAFIHYLVRYGSCGA